MLGLGRLAPMPMNNSHAKPELCVLRIEPQPVQAGLDRLLAVPHHLVRPGNQGIQLTHDRITSRRAGQTASR